MLYKWFIVANINCIFFCVYKTANTTMLCYHQRVYASEHIYKFYLNYIFIKYIDFVVVVVVVVVSIKLINCNLAYNYCVQFISFVFLILFTLKYSFRFSENPDAIAMERI